MKKIILLSLLGYSTLAFSQPYAPAAEENGSTAISHDDPQFVAWATHIEIERGYINIEDTSAMYQGSNKATYGLPEDATGPANSNSNDVVSLGDSGVAIITFEHPITNGSGFDFAVFENGLNDNFLELAHVEVSSDGNHYVRFPSHSMTQTNTPVGSFGTLAPTNLYNLAGKYKVGFGTPFDLEELVDSSNLDVTNITHLKLIDVVGSLNAHGTKDSYGNKINDLFPTPFNTSGFDLNGVGVIHENNSLDLQVEHLKFDIYPNPSRGTININLKEINAKELIIKDGTGRTVKGFNLYKKNQQKLKVDLSSGVYFVQVKTKSKIAHQKVVIQ